MRSYCRKAWWCWQTSLGIKIFRIFHKVSLWMVSKALSRSMKLICTLVFHSVHCSMMFRSLEMWLMHPTPGLNPACSFLRVTSMALLSLMWMILLNILLCSASSVTPRHVVHCALSPFVGSLTISPLHQPQVWSLHSRCYGIGRIWPTTMPWPLIKAWSIWFLTSLLGKIHVNVWISLCSKIVPPIIRSFKPQISANLSLFSFISPHPFLPWSFPFLRLRFLFLHLMMFVTVGKTCPFRLHQHHWSVTLYSRQLCVPGFKFCCYQSLSYRCPLYHALLCCLWHDDRYSFLSSSYLSSLPEPVYDCIAQWCCYAAITRPSLMRKMSML